MVNGRGAAQRRGAFGGGRYAGVSRPYPGAPAASGRRGRRGAGPAAADWPAIDAG